MSIDTSSYVASVASSLQQLREQQQQQAQLDLEIGERTRQARGQAIEQSMQDLSRQVERITEIKKAALTSRSGGIDVWA